MNETMMTVRGNVVDRPNLRRTKSGHTVANFRVASTQRRFDREQGSWVDGDTLFVSVTAWRALGENAAHSLEKGQPVVVYGRYYQRDYTKDEVVRTAYELDAVTVGHDLSRGTADFSRTVNTSAPQLETDASGAPVDASSDYIDATTDLDEHGRPAREIDLTTGEVRELTPA